MFKKKIIEEMAPTFADRKMKEYYKEQAEVAVHLQKKARQVYIRNEALKVYDLERPDGEVAEKDLIKSKYALLCLIGNYDTLIAEIKNYYVEHYGEFHEPWILNFPTSHQLIEDAITSLFNKKIF